jgi:hydroxymethylglutaryl-CoA lyase
MQGLHDFIPTRTKVEYINQLLKVGFDTIDFGSFVSPKSIPQMADTSQVLAGLDLSSTKSKLLAIIANERGASDACAYEEIDYLGYPFSISEEFQKRNTNASLDESLKRVDEINNLCFRSRKELVIYISMAFGNPYGEKWHPDIAISWCEKLQQRFNVKTIALSDTIGVSNPENISLIFKSLIPELPKVEFGAHLHTRQDNWEEKVEAAWQSGCKRFDGAIKGFGGCPMAEDELTGNMPTELMLSYFQKNETATNLDMEEFNRSMEMTKRVFPV